MDGVFLLIYFNRFDPVFDGLFDGAHASDNVDIDDAELAINDESAHEVSELDIDEGYAYEGDALLWLSVHTKQTLTVEKKKREKKNPQLGAAETRGPATQPL